MPRSAIAERALPPEKRAAPLPDAFKATLPSGLQVAWRMPDPFAIIAFDGVIPDPLTGAVLTMLKEEKAYTPESDPLKFRHDAASIKGMYALAAAMLESPKLDVSREYGDGETLGRREIGFMDVTHLYWLFRIGTRVPTVQPLGADQLNGAAHAAPDSE